MCVILNFIIFLSFLLFRKFMIQINVKCLLPYFALTFYLQGQSFRTTFAFPKTSRFLIKLSYTCLFWFIYQQIKKQFQTYFWKYGFRFPIPLMIIAIKQTCYANTSKQVMMKIDLPSTQNVRMQPIFPCKHKWYDPLGKSCLKFSFDHYLTSVQKVKYNCGKIHFASLNNFLFYL